MLTKSDNSSTCFDTSSLKRSPRQTLGSSLLRGFFRSVWISNIPYVCATYHIQLAPYASVIFLMCVTWHIELVLYTFRILLVCVTWHIQLVLYTFLIFHTFTTRKLKLIHFVWITLRWRLKMINLLTLCFISLYILLIVIPLYLQKNPHVQSVLRLP
jgi:hypothetical protein